MSREIRLFNPENSKNTVAVPSSDTDDTPVRAPKWTNNLAVLEAFPWWLWQQRVKTQGAGLVEPHFLRNKISQLGSLPQI